MSFFKAKIVKICNKNMDLWTTINPRRRRGKFLKTTKTRREAAKIFWKQQDPGQKIRPKFLNGGGFKCYLPGTSKKPQPHGAGPDIGPVASGTMSSKYSDIPSWSIPIALPVDVWSPRGR